MKKRRSLSMPFLLTAVLAPALGLAAEKPAPSTPHVNSPPPPKKALPKPNDLSRVHRNPDGTCTEYPDTSCPPNVHCNPGPPRQVECPPEPPKKK